MMIGTRKEIGWPLASPDIPRSASAPAQPKVCRFQKARFLLAKNGVGLKGSIAIGNTA